MQCLSRNKNVFVVSYLTSNHRKRSNFSVAAWEKKSHCSFLQTGSQKNVIETCTASSWCINSLFLEIDAEEWGKFLHTKNKVCLLWWWNISVINIIYILYSESFPLIFSKRRSFCLLYDRVKFSVLLFMSRRLLKTFFSSQDEVDQWLSIVWVTDSAELFILILFMLLFDFFSFLCIGKTRMGIAEARKCIIINHFSPLKNWLL